MITEAIIVALLGLVSFVLSLLPDDTLDWPESSGVAAFFGDIAGPFDVWLPVTETVTVTALTITVVLPALLVYRLAMWVWTLLPDSVSGSGPA